MWGYSGGMQAARVRAADGQVLDNPPVPRRAAHGWRCSTAPAGQWPPTGRISSIVWFEELGSGPAPRQSQLRAVRMRGADGAVLDATPRQLLPPHEGHLSHRYGVCRIALCDHRGFRPRPERRRRPGTQASRLDRSGTPVGSTIPLGESQSSNPRTYVAAGGPDLALVVSGAGEMRGRRLRVSDGVVLDPDGFVIAPVSYTGSHTKGGALNPSTGSTSCFSGRLIRRRRTFFAFVASAWMDWSSTPAD